MNKQTVVQSYNGILFSHEKERNTDTCYNVDELENVPSKRGQSKRSHIMWFHLYEILRITKSTGTESRFMVSMCRKKSRWGKQLKWVQGFIWGCWRCLYQMPLNCSFWNDSFYVKWISPQLKNTGSPALMFQGNKKADKARSPDPETGQTSMDSSYSDTEFVGGACLRQLWNWGNASGSGEWPLGEVEMWRWEGGHLPGPDPSLQPPGPASPWTFPLPWTWVPAWPRRWAT